MDLETQLIGSYADLLDKGNAKDRLLLGYIDDLHRQIYLLMIGLKTARELNTKLASEKLKVDFVNPSKSGCPDLLIK